MIDLPEPAKAIARRGVVATSSALRRAKVWSWAIIPAAWRRPFEIVESYDYWKYVADLTTALSKMLHAAGVSHLVLPARPLSHPRVVLAHEDRHTVLRLLRSGTESASWWYSPALFGLVGRARPVRGRWPRSMAGWTGILVSRNLVTATGIPLLDNESGVLVQFWTRLTETTPGKGGGQHPSGTLVAPDQNGVLGYAEPGLWQAIQDNHHRLASPPHLLTVTEPIDVVYTWVDGADPVWIARKAAALNQPVAASYTTDAAINARFESRDELKYSLRSIEMFANWVRRIWIVTDQQVPSWLQSDDRLRVVDHRQIFTDPSVLPVFNSHAIESQLHHIPGLAERYLYFNDDMLFGSPVAPEDFFHANQVHKFFTSPAMLDVGDHDPQDLAVTAAGKNNRDLLQQEFGQTITHKLRHTPQAQSRSLMEEFEASHPALFDEVMRSRFRQDTDYSITSSLSQYWAYAKGRAVTGRSSNAYVDIAQPHAEFVLTNWLRQRRAQFLCLNDSGITDPEFLRRRNAFVATFFEAYFPLPSRWERRPSA